jgi:hypothetical protein
MEAGSAFSSTASTTLLHRHANVLSEINSFINTLERAPEYQAFVSFVTFWFGFEKQQLRRCPYNTGKHQLY